MGEFLTFCIVVIIIVDGLNYTKTGKTIFDNFKTKENGN